MTQLWRLNINPDAKKDIDPKKFCFDEGILGLGWPVEWNGDTRMTRVKYWELGERKYGDGRWKAAANAICYRMAENDLCWTRDNDAQYYIGRITSDWEYCSGKDYLDADVVNVRKCEWYRTGGIDSVPGRVSNSFITRRTLQRVHDETSLIYSKILFNELSKNNYYYDVSNEKELDLFSLIAPDDCEDIVGIYLQECHAYRIIPSTCKRSTMKTEFVLKSAKGKKAYIQVKQGPNTSLNRDNFKGDGRDPCKWYLFTTSGQYSGSKSNRIHCLEPKKIRKFASTNPRLMSDRVQKFLKFCEIRKT